MDGIEADIAGDRIELRRSDAAKRPLLQRLNRIEGQVRGLRGMVEADRYCLDEVQQINAITAALREVALVIIAEHVAAGVSLAARADTPESVAVADVMRVLRAAMRKSE
ncbi:metal-sensitive transcriptional regulator [Methylobacterium amylolyticum]|uniref:metal-sensitive transcriptional regulator n=1 Tax=Methylobacterium sp. NEAU 140 TaxID=3064945 RepID=UPI003520BD55